MCSHLPCTFDGWVPILDFGLHDFSYFLPCHNSNFGLVTKAKGLQGCEPRESTGVTSHIPRTVEKCEGVDPHTPKATLTLGDGILVDSRNFREKFQGSKLNGLWNSLYY